jgi:ribosomal-protein-alanine N-acetyltransferase
VKPTALAALHAACFTAPRPWAADEFAALLADPATRIETEPDGFLLWRIAGPEAELLTLAVDPARRRAGIGRVLALRFLAAARNAGAVEAFLEVAADNDAARALYTATGFAEIGRRPRYYARPDGSALDAIVMRRTLDAG